MAKKAKSLSYNEIIKLDKQNDAQLTVTVQGYELQINRVFRPSKIKLMLTEIASLIDDLKERGVDIQNTNLSILGYAQILKHFTSLSSDFPNDVEEMIRYIEVMIDNDFLAPIMNSFDAKELDKVSNTLNEVNIKLQELAAENNKEVDTDGL